ncbi:MAG: FHA domain-containing protein [Planctomycetes bacterium]|nr:FHA domain-containing protein [Planctomycetota bacterium]
MTATVTITGGPERGRVFQLEDEMVHIGRAADSGIRLSDPDLPEHQASIVRRNGRYAIYALAEGAVEVDGSGVPADRWVWLPETARVRLSRHTTLVFDARPASFSRDPEGSADVDDAAAPPPAQAAGAGAAVGARPRARAKQTDAGATPPDKRGAKSKRQVARFITDRGGDALVTLGEDGHLPELALSEQTGGRREAARREGGSGAAYIAVAISMLMSLVLLVLPEGTGGPSASQKAEARREIEDFYDRRGGELTHWQRLLREARLAHARGDAAAERRAYRRVLELLSAEDYHRLGQATATAVPSLTGDDQRLRELISVLLAE